MSYSFPTESKFMSVLRRLGFEKTAWSLRRLHCPVSKNALVLDVGSGGNPYPRANVLLDAYEETRERHWVPLTADRPTVLGFVENLPFKDQSFDFIVASHVLEHSKNPEKFLAELMRVGKAGYIETPDMFMERLNPYRDHRLEVTIRNGKLKINKKTAWSPDPDIIDLYRHEAAPIIAAKTIPQHPFNFHVRYYWSSKIDYQIVNPEVDASWPIPSIEQDRPLRGPSVLRRNITKLLRWLFSQNHRNRSIDLVRLLRCPTCTHEHLDQTNDHLSCPSCHTTYSVKNGIPLLYPQTLPSASQAA
jgi:uncharacterized protein YbaR (Trm112 family)